MEFTRFECGAWFMRHFSGGAHFWCCCLDRTRTFLSMSGWSIGPNPMIIPKLIIQSSNPVGFPSWFLQLLFNRRLLRCTQPPQTFPAIHGAAAGGIRGASRKLRRTTGEELWDIWKHVETISYGYHVLYHVLYHMDIMLGLGDCFVGIFWP